MQLAVLIAKFNPVTLNWESLPDSDDLHGNRRSDQNHAGVENVVDHSQALSKFSERFVGYCSVLDSLVNRSSFTCATTPGNYAFDNFYIRLLTFASQRQHLILGRHRSFAELVLKTLIA